jgi:cell wall-associated NlpC family hydrolase
VSHGETVAARARALVGTRFRPQGRQREHGLDCVGLVALAANLPAKSVPTGYRLRSTVAEKLLSATFEDRVKPISPMEAAQGDVLLVGSGAGQNHFLILTDRGFVHADARVGRVVETPGTIPWPMIAAWRIRELD